MLKFPPQFGWRPHVTWQPPAFPIPRGCALQRSTLPLRWCSLEPSWSAWLAEVLGTLWRSSSPCTGRPVYLPLKRKRCSPADIPCSPLHVERRWKQPWNHTHKIETFETILTIWGIETGVGVRRAENKHQQNRHFSWFYKAHQRNSRCLNIWRQIQRVNQIKVTTKIRQ